MMSVCFKENIKISTEDLNRLIESTNNDVRQVLNHLSLLAENPHLEETTRGRKCNKDMKLGPWQVIEKVFSHDMHKTMSIHDKSDLFFHDYNISPLFVQENYLGVIPNCPKYVRGVKLGSRAVLTSICLSISEIKCFKR